MVENTRFAVEISTLSIVVPEIPEIGVLLVWAAILLFSVVGRRHLGAVSLDLWYR